jgi:predicted ATPase/DNA-binding SARP family transcriptional activator
MFRFALRLLGPPRLELNEEPVTINRLKVLGLLIYLAMSPHPQRRDHLATLFWPGYESSSARGNLRRTLSDLNGTLDHHWLRVDGEQVSLARNDGFWTDVDEFHVCLASCTTHGHPASEVCPDCLDPLRQAVDLYQDDFLSGFTLSDSPEFDDWQLFQRESLRREMTNALEKLARGLSAQNELEEATTFVRHWLTLDPLEESAHRQLMWLLAARGQRNAALAQYEACREILRSEIDIDPSEETTTLHEQIRSGEVKAAVQPQQEAPQRSRTNLPPAPQSFVGRLREIDEILNLLRDEPACQLLTLVGLGGIGKTSLTLQVLHRCTGVFADGICYVPLAEVTSRANLTTAIADALGLPLAGAEPSIQIRNFLHNKKMLLFLDNFEQLLPAGGADLLSDLIAGAEGVKILITARERLNLQQEWVFPLHGLRYPGNEWQPGDPVESYEAVALFLSCVRKVDVTFPLSDETIADIVDICRMLEGIPLAIVLAASWSRVMPIQDIAAEIESSLDFLTASLRDLPERHRSMNAVLQQSWRLLNREEQTLFSRLSVFRGGFERRAAESIANARLPLLATLVDKSLLRRNTSGRYEIHSLVRQFASEQFQRSPEEYQEIQHRHSNYFTHFLQQIKEELKGREDLHAAERIRIDIENIRSAWQWAIDARDPEKLGRMAEALLLFYDMKGWFPEQKEMFSRALIALASDTDFGELRSDQVDVLALLHIGLGASLVRCGELGLAQKHLKQSLTLLHHAHARPDLLALSYFWLGHYHLFHGSYKDTIQCFGTARTLFAEADDQWGLATSLALLSVSLIYAGRMIEAATILDEALQILHRLGGGRWLPWALVNWSINNRLQGNYAQAERDLSEAALLFDNLGDLLGVSYCQRELAYLAIAHGKYDNARKWMQNALTGYQNGGAKVSLIFPLDGLGQVARLTGDYDRAQDYHDKSLRLAEEIGEPRGIATSLHNLGRLAYDRGNYAEARRLHLESIERYRELGNPHGLASALCRLGYTACRLANADQARDYFKEAFAIAHPMNARPQVMDILVGVASMRIADGLSSPQEMVAAELLTLVLEHPASEAETRCTAQTLLDRLDLVPLPSIEAPGPAQDGYERLIELWEKVVSGK